MLLVGLAAGLAGAFALTRALKSLLFEVSALDPVALAAGLRSDDSGRHTGGLDPGEPRGGSGSDDGASRRRLIGRHGGKLLFENPDQKPPKKSVDGGHR